MKVLILLALGLAAVVADPLSSKRFGERIVGGSLTTINQYPFAAALLYSSTQSSYWQSCGGTIISNRAVLSATHCFVSGNFFDPPGTWRIRAGSSYANSGGTVYNVQTIVTHPNYNGNTVDNDVAILRSPVNFVMGANVGAASIAGTNYNLADNQIVWAIGWGRTSTSGPASEQLRQVQIWTVNQATCRNRYAELGLGITDNMLCSGWLDVGGRDQCSGDSGGPLIHSGVIVGVCSWGYQCAVARYPGVNARVSRYTTWIQNNA